MIDPLAYAAKGKSVKGSLALSGMNRLSSLLRENDGEVVYQLEFGISEDGIPAVRGEVETDLILECQRCMETMVYHVKSKLRLGIVSSRERVEQLPDQYDPLLFEGEEISVASIVEDELILALPPVALHEIENCPVGDKFQTAQGDQGRAGEAAPERKNPFAVLAQLKGNLSTDASNTDEE